MQNLKNLKMQLFLIFLASLMDMSWGRTLPGELASGMASPGNIDAEEKLENIITNIPHQRMKHMNQKMNNEMGRVQEDIDDSKAVLESHSRKYAKGCPNYAIVDVADEFQGYMNRLWVVTKIIPKGRSRYLDDSVACGLHNFSDRECKCLRYYIGFNDDGSIKMQSIGLHEKSQTYRFIENRVVFVDDTYDVFQSQHVMAALISSGSPTKITSLTDEELSPEYIPFALLATDNYKTYAVFATCSSHSSIPLAWVAFTEDAFMNGISRAAMKPIYQVLTKNGIDYQQMVSVDQRNCA